jgi:hypothetical protein
MFELHIKPSQSDIKFAIFIPLLYRVVFNDNLLIIFIVVAQIDNAAAIFVLLVEQIKIMACCNHGSLWIQKPRAFCDLVEGIADVEK